MLINGTPLSLQDSDWSRALRTCLEQWLGTPAGNACGTDEESQSRYCHSLTETGFKVDVHGIDYTDTPDLDSIVGGVLCALPVDCLPAALPPSPPWSTTHCDRTPRSPNKSA